MLQFEHWIPDVSMVQLEHSLIKPQLGTHTGGAITINKNVHVESRI